MMPPLGAAELLANFWLTSHENRFILLDQKHFVIQLI
jgi:hypothetical protein